MPMMKMQFVVVVVDNNSNVREVLEKFLQTMTMVILIDLI